MRILHRLALIVVAMLAVAGCSVGDLTPDDRSDLRASIKSAAVSQIESLNASGFDPLQVDQATLSTIGVSCGLASAVTTIWREDLAELSADGLAVCDVVMRALASSAGGSG